MPVPRLRKLQRHQPAPAIIGPSITHLTTANTALSLSENAAQKTAKIVGRAGLERLGRFQHDDGEVVYDIEIAGQPETIEVDCLHILDFVTLQELECFENARFEQELLLTYETPPPVQQKKRGRRPKVLRAVGLSSDDESVPSDVHQDGLAVVVSLAQKRRRSASPARGRGRPPKKLKTDLASSSRLSRHDNVDYEHVALPQVKKRVKKPLPQDRSQFNDFDEFNEAPNEAIDDSAGSFGSCLEKPIGQSGNDQVDDSRSLPAASTSHFKSSSQLVKAAQQSTDTDEDLQPTLQKKPARGRPRKNAVKVALSEENDLESLHRQFQVKRPGKPTKSPQLILEAKYKGDSSTEDELASIQQKFGVLPRKVTLALEDPATPSSTRPSEARLHSLPQQASGGKKPKPSPGDRPGYVAPSLSKRPVESHSSDAVASSGSMASSPLGHDDGADLDTPLSQRQLRDDSNDASASSESPPPSPVPLRHSLPFKQPQTSAAIEISSDDSSSSTASSEPKRIPVPTSRPQIKPYRSQPNGMQTPAASRNTVEPAKDSGAEDPQVSSTESEDEDETAHIMDFEIPDIPSSQSFIASDSSSSRSGSEERIIHTGEVLKTKRVAGNISVSHTKRVQPRETSMRNSDELTIQYALNRPTVDQPFSPFGGNFRQNKPVPGKSRFPQSRISMQKISQQVAERSRDEVEAQKQSRALAEREQLSSSSSAESSSDSDSDSPPARPKAQPQQPKTNHTPHTQPSGKWPQRQEPFSSTFRRFSAAANQEQQPLPLHPVSMPLHPSPRLSHPPPLPLHPSPHATSSRREHSSSPSLFIPSRRQVSLSLGESSPPPPACTSKAHREMSIDLGMPEEGIQTVKPRSGSGARGGVDGLGRETVGGETERKEERKKKKKKRSRTSMTPLFPGRAGGSPIHSRKVFSTREFEGMG